jgi:HSP90 family molecular chaperone
MRFDSSSHNFTGLASYVERMKDKQPQIYYITAATREEATGSPLVESLVARGYEGIPN